MNYGINRAELRATLEALRPTHKTHLLRTRAFPNEIQSVERKLTYLAETMTVEEGRHYIGLYRKGGGTLFTWWKSEGARVPDPVPVPAGEPRAAQQPVPRQLDPILNRAVETYPNILEGLRPPIEFPGPPMLHKIVRWPDTLEIEYGIAEKPRVVQDGWDEKTIDPIHIYRVYIKENPLSVEMRAVPLSRQYGLLGLLTRDLGIELERPFACLIQDNAAQEETLRAAMDALYFGVHQKGEGNAHLDYTIIKTDREVALPQQDDFIEQLAHEHRRVYFKRFYVFTVVHPDGFEETTFYTIKVPTGEMSVGLNISELAVEKLRTNVINLF